ncbi:MAG: hypothetical protein RLZZ568_1044, partial [Cyanobacteriota bacterium]
SFFLSEVYTVVHAIPFSWAVIQTLIRPFARGFLVTPKSFLSNRFQVNFWLTIPLGLLWLGNGLTLVKFLWERNVPTAMIPPGFADLSEGTVGILIFWWMYNLIILTLAIWACIDPPKTDDCHWFKLAKPVQLTWQDKHIACSSQLIAEQGVRVQIGTSPHPQFMPGDDVEVEIQTDEWPGTIALNAQVSQIVKHSNNPSTQLMDLQFVAVTPPQYRHLVHLLFCRPGQWFRRSHPNELQTLFVLMHRLVRPRFGQKHTDKVIDAIPIR